MTDTRTLPDGSPWYARRNSSGLYTIAGVQYPSVTTVLSLRKGEYLLAWAAKMASLKAATHLIQAGILGSPDFDFESSPLYSLSPEDKSQKVLIDFAKDQTDRKITKLEAVAEIANWKTVMREFERYRDWKAAIGSIAHHCAHLHALEGSRPFQKVDLLEALGVIAWDLRLIHRTNPATGEIIAPTDAMIRSVAEPAMSYCLSVFEWIEKANPEFEAIGLEAVVYRKEFEITFDDDVILFPGYAGSMDWKATFKKSNYGFDWGWGDRQVVSATGDYKTSNRLPDTVRMQTESYDRADEIVLIENGQHFPIERSNVVACVHIGPHPSMSNTVTEFGELESKTNQLGAKLWSWERDPVTYAGFLGLCAAHHAQTNAGKAIEKTSRKAAPVKIPPTQARPCPF